MITVKYLGFENHDLSLVCALNEKYLHIHVHGVLKRWQPTEGITQYWNYCVVLHFRSSPIRSRSVGASSSVWWCAQVPPGSPPAHHPHCSLSSAGPHCERWEQRWPVEQIEQSFVVSVFLFYLAFSVLMLNVALPLNIQCFKLKPARRQLCHVALNGDFCSVCVHFFVAQHFLVTRQEKTIWG